MKRQHAALPCKHLESEKRKLKIWGGGGGASNEKDKLAIFSFHVSVKEIHGRMWHKASNFSLTF